MVGVLRTVLRNEQIIIYYKCINIKEKLGFYQVPLTQEGFGVGSLTSIILMSSPSQLC